MIRHPTQAAGLIAAALSLLLGGCGGSPDTGESTRDTTSSTPQGTSSTAQNGNDSGASVSPPHLVEGPATPLKPGTYQFSVLANPGVAPPEALIEVPHGFVDEAAWYVVSPDQQQFLGLWTVGLVDRDACPSGRGRQFDPGPSVEDLAHALVAQKSTRASTPKPVALAGQEGLYLELSSPHDISRCEQTGHLWGYPGGRGIYNDGQVDLLWILDVDGQRLVVNAAYTPKSNAADIDKLTSMVDSLEFARTGK
jgi:hypothetical protein